jgi:hypothetical protein
MSLSLLKVGKVSEVGKGRGIELPFIWLLLKEIYMFLFYWSLEGIHCNSDARR